MTLDPIIIKYPAERWTREEFHEFRHTLENATPNREIWFLSTETDIAELPALDGYTDELADRVADRVLDRLEGS